MEPWNECRALSGVWFCDLAPIRIKSVHALQLNARIDMEEIEQIATISKDEEVKRLCVLSFSISMLL